MSLVAMPIFLPNVHDRGTLAARLLFAPRSSREIVFTTGHFLNSRLASNHPEPVEGWLRAGLCVANPQKSSFDELRMTFASFRGRNSRSDETKGL